MKGCKRFFSDKKTIICLLAAVFVAAFFFGLAIGSVSIPLSDVFYVLFGGKDGSVYYNIIHYVRLPRVLSAVMVGSALAVSGAVLQSVLQNRLASPGIVGVNAGGGLFSLVALIVFPASLFAVPLGAFVGALITVLAVWTLASVTDASKSTIVLTGVAVSSIFTAVIDTMVTLFPTLQIDRLAFSVGGLADADMRILLYALPVFCTGFLGAMLLGYDLNVLSLGDGLASSLGMRTRVVRFSAMFCVALLAGSAIAIAGLLGFVGLIAPHIASRLVGNDNRILFPAAAIFGAELTLICDTVARTAFSPYELPVGIILSFIGAPFFLFLLFSSKRKRRVKR